MNKIINELKELIKSISKIKYTKTTNKNKIDTHKNNLNLQEETYNKIYEGKWISEEPYGVVHRFCVNLDLKLERKGSKLFNKIEELLVTKGIKSIKIDTHEENKSMRKTLLNNGFIYCGIIYVNNGEKRVAYEKIIS